MALLQNIKSVLSPIYHSLTYPRKAIEYRKIMENPQKYISGIYAYMNHEDLDWEHPQDLNAVIQWLKLYGDTSQWPIWADKYCVREYVKNKGLGDMLIPLLGVWKHVWNIPWKELPNRFVIKPNNGSSNVVICCDKSSINYLKLYSESIINEHRKYGYANYEPHYMGIKPCVIVEQLLDVSKQNAPSSSLIDYKFYCINGEPCYVWMVFNRTKQTCEACMYDMTWNKHNEYCVSTPHYHIYYKDVPKPVSFDRMVEAARKLSEGIPFVRIDLYEVDRKPYFGEMTLTPAGGFIDFHTREFLQLSGRDIQLKKA